MEIMKRVLKSLAHRLGLEITRLPPAPRNLVFDETMELDRGLLKEFATRAAQFSTSPDITESIRKLHLAGVFRERPVSQYGRIEIGDERTVEVGLWRKESTDKSAPFVRQANRRQEWFNWAKQDKLEPKRFKWRVAFLGESVARGYLYDPQFTPASVLQQLLRSHLGAAQIDVVDLGKSNLMMAELKTLAGQCLALRPDVIVIFAGNNWRPHISDSDVPYVETLLRTHGAPALKSFLDARQQQDVAHLISQINSLVATRNIKLVWVLPEFNLTDWSDPVSNAPLLIGQGNREWRNLNEEAARALREGDLATAEKLAGKMVQLDAGTNSVPLRILAQSSRADGDVSAERRSLELARDAEGWNPTYAYSPRVTSVIQKVLREAASVGGNVVVDVPEILNRHLNGALPNRRVFLDYAHLTAEGINVTMAAVASKVIASLTGKTVDAEHLKGKSALP
jgi:hypothetical protein